MVMNPSGLRPEEGCAGEAQQQQTGNCLKIIKEGKKLVAGPRWVPDTKTDWPTHRRP
jgi:hypothetical protein